MKKLIAVILLLSNLSYAQTITNPRQGQTNQVVTWLGGMKFEKYLGVPLLDSLTPAYVTAGFYTDFWRRRSDSVLMQFDPRTGYSSPINPSGAITPDMFGVKPNTGSDMTTGMQNAINYSSSRNLPLILAAGTYLVANLVLPSNSNLSGQSFNTILQLTNGTATDRQVFTVNQATSKVVLRDLIVDANRSNNSGSNIVCIKVINNDTTAVNKIEYVSFKNVTFRNSKDRALAWFRGFRIENTTIEGCTFTNAGVQALELRGCRAFTFRNNKVTAWGELNVNAPGFGLQSVINDGINIEGNFFTNTVGGQFAIESAGAFVQNSSVTSNTFDGNHLPAAGISGYFRNCTFSFNKHINGVGTHRTGYELIGNDLLVSKNYIDNGAIVFTSDEVNPVAEVRPNGNNCIISTNIIKTVGVNASSIYLNGFVRNDTISTVKNVLVENNLIDNRGSTGNATTISLGFYGTAGLVSGIRIQGNKIYGDASQSCIRFRSYSVSDNIRILDNEFLSGQYGVRVDNTASWQKVEISRNDFRGMSLGEYINTGSFIPEFKFSNNTTLKNYRYLKIDDKRIIASGTGSPLNVVSADQGSIYLNTSGGTGVTMYVKETGVDSAGWTAFSIPTGFATLAGNQTFTGANTFSQTINITADNGGIVVNSDRGGPLVAAALSCHSASSSVENIILSGSRPGTISTQGFGLRIGLDNETYFTTTNAAFNFVVSTSQKAKLFNTGNWHFQPEGGTFTDIASAAVAINSTAKGFLPPRMTSAQRTAIVAPATGLLVFDTTLGEYAFYNGTVWKQFTSTIIP